MQYFTPLYDIVAIEKQMMELTMWLQVYIIEKPKSCWKIDAGYIIKKVKDIGVIAYISGIL
ncbi:MAG: hypothetical protein A2231_09415 [Candidatus Firestonebacteria bacterium RIFOXYA2_FULL_40_8]|nr:MAG: hypothetical protein A2231_09415 [Candidatus Firestonebacteria bacterium RIFOXYA2_FULL_40_8]